MKKNIFSASRYFLFLSFVAALFLYSSCDKDDDTLNYLGDSTIVEGRILEFGTNIPIANATVMLKECETPLFGLRSCFQWKSMKTGEDGYYKFKYKAKKIGDGTFNKDVSFSYRLEAEIEAYFENHFMVQPDHHTKDHNLTLDPHAYLKLHIKNVNPFDMEDRIRYNGPWGGSNESHLGTKVDFYDLQKNRGNSDYIVSWWVRKNDIMQHYLDTIYLPAHDTTFFEILY